jgi:hypothetical protein
MGADALGTDVDGTEAKPAASTSAVRRVTVIHRIDLDLGPKIGSGAQGQLFTVESVRAAVPAAQRSALPDTLVFKEFHAGTVVSGPALEGLARFRAGLDDDERQVIDTMTVWPCAVVHDGSERPCGYLMRSIPRAFFQPIETTVGSERIPREIQELFVPDTIARKNFGETANGIERQALAREMAFILGFLHKRDIVYGDLSYKNAVFCLRPHPAVILLDCDAVRRVGESAGVPQLHSPGWKPPESGPQTKASDRYKLGLFVLRVVTPGVNAQNRDPEKARGHLDDAGLSLLRRALGDDPDRRTTGKEWVQYFNARIASAGGVRTRTGSAPKPHRPSTRRAPAHPSRTFARRPMYRAVPHPARVTTRSPMPIVFGASSFVRPHPPVITRSGAIFTAAFFVILTALVAILAVGLANSASQQASRATVPTTNAFDSPVDSAAGSPVTLFARSAGSAVTASKKFVNAIDQRPVGLRLDPGAYDVSEPPPSWIVEFAAADPDRSSGQPVWTIRNIETDGTNFKELAATTATGEQLTGLEGKWAAGLDDAVVGLASENFNRLRYLCDPGGPDCVWEIVTSNRNVYFAADGAELPGAPTWLDSAT